MELKNSRVLAEQGWNRANSSQNHKVELDALSQNMLKIRPQTNVPPGKMELKNSRSSGRAGLEPSELKSKLKVELDALSQNMLKIRPQTKCSPRKNGIKKFPEFWPSRAGTERTQVKTIK